MLSDTFKACESYDQTIGWNIYRPYSQPVNAPSGFGSRGYFENPGLAWTTIDQTGCQSTAVLIKSNCRFGFACKSDDERRSLSPPVFGSPGSFVDARILCAHGTTRRSSD